MAGSALGVAMLTVSTALAVGLGTVGGAAAFTQRLAGNADAAALAAADAVSGAATGVPCERAGEVASTAGATVASCTVDGAIATVTLTASFGPIAVSVPARAGPPP